VDINECESSPCQHGSCSNLVRLCEIIPVLFIRILLLAEVQLEILSGNAKILRNRHPNRK
jgi:hypothetical protein